MKSVGPGAEILRKTAWPSGSPGVQSSTIAAAVGVLMAGMLPVAGILLVVICLVAGLIVAPVVGIRAIVRWRR